MRRREQLLADWQTRLREADRALVTGHRTLGPPAHGTLWARIYSRVLRYLLRRYSRPEEGAPWRQAESPAFSATPATALLPEVARDGGAPPKSGDRIRAVLEKAREANTGRAQHGPLESLGPDDWIVVGFYSGNRRAYWAAEGLRERKIPARVQRLLLRSCVLVRRVDYERAVVIADYVYPSYAWREPRLPSSSPALLRAGGQPRPPEWRSVAGRDCMLFVMLPILSLPLLVAARTDLDACLLLVPIAAQFAMGRVIAKMTGTYPPATHGRYRR
jgi:hypothetical protein